MKYTAALRVTGEICFYFSILSLFAAFRPWLIPMAAFAAACLAVALIAVRLRSAPVRALLALLPGVCFLFTPWSLLLIFPGLAWLYFIAYLGLGRFGIALYDYRGAFRWMLIISAFVLAGQAINSMLFHGAAISYVSLAFLGVFVLLSVAALRGMQMGAPMDRRWHAANVLTVAGSLIAAVGISLGLYLLYRHSVPLILVLLSPLKRFLAWLFGLIRFEAVTETPRATPPPETPPTLFENKEQIVMGPGGLYTEEPERFTYSHLADQALTVGAILILAFLVFIVLWVIVKLLRRGKAMAEEYVEYEPTEDFTPDRRGRKAPADTARGRAQIIRRLYREYLDYLRENGLRRSASDTSAEILAESERIDPNAGEEEKQLRRIYLKARYGTESVTEEDVAAARACLDAIRRNEKR